MIVKLTYFKLSGKYYSEGHYVTHKEHLFEIWDEVRGMQRTKNLPGLMHGHSEFVVLVNVPEHRHRHPYLILVG